MASYKDFDWKTSIKECLDSTLVGVLATKSRGNVWATPIYFSYDDTFNLYFISPKEARHMHDIEENPLVALAIVTPNSVSGIYQIALQIEGMASEVPDKDIEKVYERRSMRMAGDNSWVPMPVEGHFVKEHGGVFMKIAPKSMNYMDTRYFGGNSKKVPMDKLLKAK